MATPPILRDDSPAYSAGQSPPTDPPTCGNWIDSRFVPRFSRAPDQGSRIAASVGSLRSRGRASGPGRAAPSPAEPVVLLDNVSPYGSRRIVVEYDGRTTSAYLHDGGGPVAA